MDDLNKTFSMVLFSGRSESLYKRCIWCFHFSESRGPQKADMWKGWYFYLLTGTRTISRIKVTYQLCRTVLFNLQICAYVYVPVTKECCFTWTRGRDSIHCKKRLSFFPFPAGMSLTKVSLKSLLSDVPTGDGKNDNLFLQRRGRLEREGLKWLFLF